MKKHTDLIYLPILQPAKPITATTTPAAAPAAAAPAAAVAPAAASPAVDAWTEVLARGAAANQIHIPIFNIPVGNQFEPISDDEMKARARQAQEEARQREIADGWEKVKGRKPDSKQPEPDNKAARASQ